MSSTGRIKRAGRNGGVARFPVDITPTVGISFAVAGIAMPPAVAVNRPVAIDIAIRGRKAAMSSPAALDVCASGLAKPGSIFSPGATHVIASTPVTVLGPGRSGALGLAFACDSLFKRKFRGLFFIISISGSIRRAGRAGGVTGRILRTAPPRGVSLIVLGPAVSGDAILPKGAMAVSTRMRGLNDMKTKRGALELCLSASAAFSTSSSLVDKHTLASITPGSDDTIRDFSCACPPGKTPKACCILLITSTANAIFRAGRAGGIDFIRFAIPTIRPKVSLLISGTAASSKSIAINRRLAVGTAIRGRKRGTSNADHLNFCLSSSGVFGPTASQLLAAHRVTDLGAFNADTPRDCDFACLSRCNVNGGFVLMITSSGKLIARSGRTGGIRTVTLSTLPSPGHPSLIITSTRFRVASSVSKVAIQCFVGGLKPEPAASKAVAATFCLSGAPVAALDNLDGTILLGARALGTSVTTSNNRLASVLALRPKTGPGPV